MKTLALCAILVVMPALTGAQSRADIARVFLTSAGAKDGLTDPSEDNRDSVHGIRESSPRWRKTFVLVDAADGADIVVTVLGRDRAGNDGAIRVRMVYRGGFTTDFAGHGTRAGRWTLAANSVVDQVGTWIKANASRIAADRVAEKR